MRSHRNMNEAYVDADAGGVVILWFVKFYQFDRFQTPFPLGKINF